MIAGPPSAQPGVTLWTFLLPTAIAHGLVFALFLVQTVGLGHLRAAELKLAAALVAVASGVALLGIWGRGVGALASCLYAGLAGLISATAYAAAAAGAAFAWELLQGRRP